MNEFEAATLADGKAFFIQDGVLTSISYETEAGRKFIYEFLEILKERYPDMIMAVDDLLKSDFRDKYERIKINKLYYQYLQVTTSINCCFGDIDQVLDYDDSGKFHFEFVKCPRRLTCPYNGYAEKNKKNKLVICNPVLKTSLSNMEIKILDYLINTKLEASEIANLEKLSIETVKTHRTNIYAKIGVNSRIELTTQLKGQHII